jgi:hypothetical protein
MGYVLDINGCDLSFHVHRFTHCAGLQRTVHCYGDIGWNSDWLLCSGEPLHCKRYSVITGPDVDDCVTSLAVCGDCALALDQRRAGSFDGDAHHHAPGGIMCHAGD